MKIIESRIYTKLIPITDYILLSILWIIVSLPLVTIIPASVAIIATIKKWTNEGTGNIFVTFFRNFRKSFISNTIISIISLFLLSIVFSWLNSNNQIFILFGSIFMTVYLTAVFSWIDICSMNENMSFMKKFEMSGFDLLFSFKNNIACCLLFVAFIILVYLFPLSIFILSSGFWKVQCILLSKKKKVIL